MTTVHTELGYLERPYGEDPYLGGFVMAATGFQFTAVVNAQRAEGFQYLGIMNKDTPKGFQFTGVVNDDDSEGFQFNGVVRDDDAEGFQYLGILKKDTPTGFQFNGVVGSDRDMGFQFRADKLPHAMLETYLTDGYMTGPYLTRYMAAFESFQFLGVLRKDTPTGFQYQGVIKSDRDTGFQFLGVVKDDMAVGFQWVSQRATAAGFQFNATLYNVTNLRILSDFPSRGTVGGNWTANSTEPGDFSVQNLNTDIVEQIWRSATGDKTGVTLICDTGLAQGVFVDTFALLGHNLSGSASVTVEGSTVSNFASIGTSFVLPAASVNTFWVAPTLPMQGFRYWRVTIDDPNNPNNFVSAGVIVFGAAMIFQGECFVDTVGFQLKDFADTVRTEGHTNVANSRAQKRVLQLDFRSLGFNVGNFRKLRSVFNDARTTLKCLYIPTPHTTDHDYMARFAVFGKLSGVPMETHKVHAADADYVTVSIEIDESM